MRSAPLVVEDGRQSSRKRLYALVGSGLALMAIVWLFTRDRAPAGPPQRPEIARIAQLEAKKDTAALLEATKSEDTEVAQRAVEGLGKIGPEAREQIQAALRDRRPPVREVAIARLADVTDREHVDVINQTVRADPSPGVRATAARALGQLRAWNGMDTLIAGLNDPDPFVRRCAMEAIKTITGAHYVYDADGTAAQRAQVMAQIRKELPILKRAYDAYMQRQAQNGSRQ
jgi:HEAT repeat protein